jgi:hypothetical protein
MLRRMPRLINRSGRAMKLALLTQANSRAQPMLRLALMKQTDSQFRFWFWFLRISELHARY